ncbi:fimbrial biogenesis chaperone [Roseateles violae]|uniref:Fimbria/pilus periplasmic chaperone n=1 Tax=Roseateles violae TaxID=3058042 RepID=A0ABT8DNX1_9BURK|nr:fimbria/pilus periplasmic chaperone [Pelomonas sp. PFR6]MDN3919701.1 fimbria/pilus periplasmic chaperone [Pelomonas sp. PFR6]
MRLSFATAMRIAMLLAGAPAADALAGGFSVSPIGLSLDSRDASASVRVLNTSDETIVVQSKALKWSQAQGRDSTVETRELLVNPPIFRLAPGEEQLVRVAPRNSTRGPIEDAYRLLIREVPPKEEPASGRGAFRIAVAHNMPVYIRPPTPDPNPAANWRAERTAEGVRLIGENGGTSRYRIQDVEFSVGDARLQRTFLVVLAQSRLELDLALRPDPASRSLQIRAQDEAGRPVSIDVPLEERP